MYCTRSVADKKFNDGKSGRRVIKKDLLRVQTYFTVLEGINTLNLGKTEFGSKKKHQIKCNLKKSFSSPPVLAIYCVLLFFQTCLSPGDHAAWRWNKRNREALGIAPLGHSSSLVVLMRPKEKPVVSEPEPGPCLRVRNALLIFLDSLPLPKNCWCWSCED